MICPQCGSHDSYIDDTSRRVCSRCNEILEGVLQDTDFDSQKRFRFSQTIMDTAQSQNRLSQFSQLREVEKVNTVTLVSLMKDIVIKCTQTMAAYYQLDQNEAIEIVKELYEELTPYMHDNVTEKWTKRNMKWRIAYKKLEGFRKRHNVNEQKLNVNSSDDSSEAGWIGSQLSQFKDDAKKKKSKRKKYDYDEYLVRKDAISRSLRDKQSKQRLLDEVSPKKLWADYLKTKSQNVKVYSMFGSTISMYSNNLFDVITTKENLPIILSYLAISYTGLKKSSSLYLRDFIKSGLPCYNYSPLFSNTLEINFSSFARHYLNCDIMELLLSVYYDVFSFPCPTISIDLFITQFLEDLGLPLELKTLTTVFYAFLSTYFKKSVINVLLAIFETLKCTVVGWNGVVDGFLWKYIERHSCDKILPYLTSYHDYLIAKQYNNINSVCDVALNINFVHRDTEDKKHYAYEKSPDHNDKYSTGSDDKSAISNNSGDESLENSFNDISSLTPSTESESSSDEIEKMGYVNPNFYVEELIEQMSSTKQTINYTEIEKQRLADKNKVCNIMKNWFDDDSSGDGEDHSLSSEFNSKVNMTNQSVFHPITINDGYISDHSSISNSSIPNQSSDSSSSISSREEEVNSPISDNLPPVINSTSSTSSKKESSSTSSKSKTTSFIDLVSIIKEKKTSKTSNKTREKTFLFK
ncbi:hypothetical protein QTN25_005842 [Entamoeba marina]